MPKRPRTPQEEAERERFRKGLPDHHDPTAGIGGAPPAYSALTLRLVLAGFGLVFCLVAGVWLLADGGPVWLAVVLLVLAAVAVVDLVVVARRKRRGEPG
jgi:Flp pilus assembly protein TadB